MAKRKTTTAGKTTRKPNVRRILNVLPSPKQEHDWLITDALAAGALAAGAAIPATKDLRAAWWGIGDQGSTGSCVGWACADGLLRWHFVKANRLPNTAFLSVRFIWMASKETDVANQRPTTFIEEDGTFLKAALDVARKFGAVREGLLPFGTGQLYQGTEASFYAKAAQRRIDSYFNLQIDVLAWKQWIANNGPIMVRLDVDSTWDGVGADGHLDVYNAGSTRGGHAVSIVGYTADRFIVRNSWGTTWGDGGFAYASHGYATAAFTEAYGVSVS